MDLFDFFYPEQAQAKYLRKIAARQSFASNPPLLSSRQDEDISSLKSDVRFLTLVLMAILKRLGETETMSLADVKDLLDEIDKLDGASDCGLEPGVLRGILGVVKQESAPESTTEEDGFKIIADVLKRHRP